MPYKLEIPPKIEQSFKKLYRKDRAMWERVKKALDRIQARPTQVGDSKRHGLKGCRGLHIGPFVLLWEARFNRVKIVLFDHHDHAYK